MGYEKENIDRARDMGMFDNNALDPAVLSLDDEEKARLARQLKENADGGGVSGAPEEDAPGRTPGGRKQEERLSLWDRIVFFFQKLFMGVSRDEFLLRKALSRVQAAVRHYRPSLYSSHSGKVTGELGNLIYKLAAQMGAFSKVINLCRSKKMQEEGAGIRFPEFVLSQYVESLPDLEKKFGYSYVKNNPGLFVDRRIRETLEKEIDSGLQTIPHEKRSQSNALYANLVAYERLSEFNFYSLLRKFGQNLTKLEGGFPDFSPVEGNSVLYDLTKLENLIFAIDLSMDMFPLFSAVGRFYNSLKEASPGMELPEWRSLDASKMVDAINALLREERITNLIRLISRKPFHLPNIRTYQVSLLEEVRQSILAVHLPRCQALVHQVEVDGLNSKIKCLFGSDPLSVIDFYNEKTNVKLSEFGLPLFTNSRYLQIIKTYYERLFAVLIKPALNIVVVDGDFFDKMLYTKLGDYFYKFEEVSGMLADFEKKISSATAEGKKIRNMFKNYSGDAPTQKVITEKIHYLNNLSGKVIREAAGRLGTALPALQAIVTDAFSSNKPEFLLNIKQLGGSRNRAIIKAVQKAAEATSLVHGILKTFL